VTPKMVCRSFSSHDKADVSFAAAVPRAFHFQPDRRLIARPSSASSLLPARPVSSLAVQHLVARPRFAPSAHLAWLYRPYHSRSPSSPNRHPGPTQTPAAKGPDLSRLRPIRLSN